MSSHSPDIDFGYQDKGDCVFFFFKKTNKKCFFLLSLNSNESSQTFLLSWHMAKMKRKCGDVAM